MDIEVLPFLKALADESRLKILGLLAERERSVEELATLLGLRAPTVSHHLAALREVGLASMRSEGTTHVYHFNPAPLRSLNRQLAPERLAEIPDDLEADAWERKVLGDYLENGRLKQIPATHRKRLVVLKWLAGKFEPDRRYVELEVNAILAEFHDDYASLRRYLVDEGFMDRRAGVYWRTESAE